LSTRERQIKYFLYKTAAKPQLHKWKEHASRYRNNAETHNQSCIDYITAAEIKWCESWANVRWQV